MTAPSRSLKELFLAALEVAPEDRAAWLERECAADAGLRKHLGLMLAAHDAPQSLLDRPAAAPLAGCLPPEGVGLTVDQPIAERPGTVIGPYKLLQQIGEGGFGVVYMAEQERPVRRMVALKIIKPGMDTREVIARFESERQALAIMDHPNIAKVLDAGATESGFPYFVMELVKGVPITEFCDKNHVPTEGRLKLFLDVCHAVQHAHHKGVIHRDIKPSNVMVTLHDGVSVVKVIDFGVAKATVQKLTERTLFTAYGQMIGTPAYMSPEQAEMSGLDIDTRSDIYSLGVLLYELLTGTTPLESKRLREAGYAEMQRLIREEEPPRPSNRLSSLGESATLFAGNRSTDPKQLARLLAGDLDWIVMKALEKDRNRRYGTPGNFAEDIERYLRREAILARPPSAPYRLRKFVQRNRAAVLLSLFVLATVMAVFCDQVVGYFRIRAERDRAELARREADEQRELAEGASAEEAKQRKIAEAEKQKAEQAEADTLADYRASTDDAIEQLIGSKPTLGAPEKAYLEKTLKRWQMFADRQGEDERSRAIRGEGHFRVGRLWSYLGQLNEARAEYESARNILAKLTEEFPAVADYQALLANAHNNLGNLLADVGQRSEARIAYECALELRRKLAEQFPDLPANQHELAGTEHNLGALLKNMGEWDKARAAFGRARDLQETMVEQRPGIPSYQYELARIHDSLGTFLADLGQRDEACREYERARDVIAKLTEQFPDAPAYQHQLAGTHNNFGKLLANSGKRDEAVREYEFARDASKKLAEQFPIAPVYQQYLAGTYNNLGALLVELGQGVAAQNAYERARDIWKKLADQLPDVPEYQLQTARAHNNLGNLLDDLGRRDEALTEYELARNVHKRLTTQFPAVPAYQQELATTQNNLAALLKVLGRRAEAHTEFMRARDIQEKLAKQFPAVPAYQYYLAGTCNNLANLLKQLGQSDQARAEYERALAIQHELCERFPEGHAYPHQLAITHINLGLLLADLRQYDEARREYEGAHDIFTKLAEQFPSVPAYQQQLSMTHHNIGALLEDLGQHGEARAEYERALDIKKTLSEQFPEVPDYQDDLANTHSNLGVVLAKLGRQAEARAEYEQAQSIWKKLADLFPAVPAYKTALGGAYGNYGCLVRNGGEPADSLQWFDIAIRTLNAVCHTEPADIKARRFLRNNYKERAHAYDRLQKYSDAVRDWDKAIELSPMPERPPIQALRAISQIQGGLVTEAIAEVEQLTKVTKWPPDQWYDFACVYSNASGKMPDNKQEYADRAMEFLRKAVNAGFKDAANMAKDTDLDPLREREDFKKLIAELDPSAPNVK
jgi:serine/threonine protein kinase/Flp pilus assembly protein TadD